ncbi:DNA-binding response regulator [Bacillus sp. V2I10]|uniref:response regulator transcription factor n=1 Tax=Bacillus sp. V2I10 TaxID=3042276 RepID=UPI002782A67F|nr:DNA-binding response regulator [Bacillus sp. V2I10]MDQ0861743.1 two-component system response regulator YesN [Bacillus sp. V2I10]
MHILLVDDEPLELEQLEYIIQHRFPYWTIHKAIDASKALKVIHEHPISLALLDIQLPGKSGIDLGLELKSQKKLDIVMVTAFQSFDYAQASIRLGAKDYITKPIIEEELCKILENYQHSDVQSHIIQEAINIIHEQYSQKLSLSFLANQIHINSAYLSRKFHEEMKISFSEYLNEYRIEMAKQLLQDSEKSISSISEECGFNSQHYFSVLFKKQTGLSPREYRLREKV